ncbi:unnamed protein product [Lactuca virosa]|uniref:Secreted protein n=1 Tax=Lactuca virosa TaxID=75947 RepID=A0AAU9MIW2_9ASTR|nr:unnamed protein product [Lactuca virosa]
MPSLLLLLINMHGFSVSFLLTTTTSTFLHSLSSRKCRLSQSQSEGGWVGVMLTWRRMIVTTTVHQQPSLKEMETMMMEITIMPLQHNLVDEHLTLTVAW